MKERTMIFHNNRIYVVSDMSEGGFLVVGAVPLPNGQKLVDTMAQVPVETEEEVREIITTGKLKQYSMLGKK
ncbi:hypothetical protein HOBO_173 [Bacillus phage Hobo]|uniref:Uncharacterized protein n=2 Tax=Caeruleovirus BM15 TaxID=1985178 RepID=A0A0S2MUN6_9CAUD|nr:hypothetical protein FD732_gp169 [Bacillus phage BM15]ALO79580.1 hypothetical protein BM10_176 [Bacillus phage BM15]AXQ66931.1 hypothetical protein HOBO_173 [Bacillus phage Hobo]